AGRLDEAIRILDEICAFGLDRIRPNSAWAQHMSWVAHAVGLTGHRGAAAAVAPLVRPFPTQRPYTAVTLAGSLALPLGICERVLGHFEEADAAFEEAEIMSEQLAAPYWIALTRLEWGIMLRARGADGDPATATELLTDASAIARDRGYASLEGRARAAL